MRVTIIADASFCPKTGVAGYGFWIAGERGKQGGEGAVKGLCDTNSTAEMQALVNALHIAVRAGLVSQGDAVLLQTDCEAAIQAFEGTRKRLSELEHATKQAMKHLRHTFALSLEYRHVKGHSKSTEARYAANNHCDRGARRAMRKARTLHLQQTKQGDHNET